MLQLFAIIKQLLSYDPLMKEEFLTFLSVNAPTTAGPINPGMVANVFVIPTNVPVYKREVEIRLKYMVKFNQHDLMPRQGGILMIRMYVNLGKLRQIYSKQQNQCDHSP